MSTLLTTCLPYVKDTLDHLNGKGVRSNYAVIIGGAAPTAEFANAIGADGIGHSAAEAVRICIDLMQTRKSLAA
jgi:methanogenic corrinoid protein MtbC1